MNYMKEYKKLSAFAAAYAEQQMLDRDAGRIGLASFCQKKSAEYYSEIAKMLADEMKMENTLDELVDQITDENRHGEI